MTLMLFRLDNRGAALTRTNATRCHVKHRLFVSGYLTVVQIQKQWSGDRVQVLYLHD